ncbi:MAG TPA: ABC transporter ATP-binding protein [Candidatus Tumulicola sp.]
MIVELRDVDKSYGPIRALDGLSLRVKLGEIVGILGPNGAGKTTAIDIVLGLRRPDRGTALLFDAPPTRAAARRHAGVTPQESGFPDALTVEEILRFAAVHYERPRPLDEILDDFGLGELRARRAGALSVGQSRRLALALAFIGNTELVVLDEPTAGLDVESRRRLWDFVRRNREGRSILFSTHYLEEAEAAATRIVVIDRGKIRFDGDPLALRSNFGLRRVRYVGEPLDPHDARTTHDEDGRTVALTPDSDAYVRELVRRDIAFSQLEVTAPSLEEAFLALTQERT